MGLGPAPARPPGIHQEIKLLIVGLIIGTCSIVLAGSFRDVIDAVFQMTVPVSEKQLGTGGYLFLWRFCYFIIALSILIMISILLV
jgi:hypothetical protein